MPSIRGSMVATLRWFFMNRLEDFKNSEWQQELMVFLESSERPPFTMNFYQLDGYLKALTLLSDCANDDWYSLVFGDQPLVWQHHADALPIRESIQKLVDFHRQQLQQGRCDLPLEVAYSRNREDRMDLEQWARGFLQGYSFQDDQWSSLLECAPVLKVEGNLTTESLADEMDAVLYIVSTVADADLAVAQGVCESEIESIFRRLPVALAELAQSVKRHVSLHTGIDTVPRIV